MKRAEGTEAEEYSPQWAENTCSISCLPDHSYSLKISHCLHTEDLLFILCIAKW